MGVGLGEDVLDGLFDWVGVSEEFEGWEMGDGK